MNAQSIIEKLSLSPHPEGGYYCSLYRSPHKLPTAALPDGFKGVRDTYSSVYYLLESGDFSALHRIRSDELWHFYAGCLNTVSLRDIGLDLTQQNPRPFRSWAVPFPLDLISKILKWLNAMIYFKLTLSSKTKFSSSQGKPMLIFKMVISGIMIGIASELGKRTGKWGGLVLSLPLTSIIAFLWIWFETKDATKVAALSTETIFFVLPSFAFFIVLPILLNQSFQFYTAFAFAILAALVSYFLFFKFKGMI